MVIVFRTKELANQILKEIAVTPFGFVIFWAGNPDVDFLFDAENTVTGGIEGADGRFAICHNFCEEDVDWLEAYLAAYMTAGDVVIADKLPNDWQYPQEAI